MSASPAQNQVAVYAIRFPVDGAYGAHRVEEVVAARFGPDSIVRFNFGLGRAVPVVSAKKLRGEDGDYWRHEART